MVRLAICEDDYTQADTILGYIKALTVHNPDITCDVYNSGDSLLDYYKRVAIDGYYDIIFFDIEMEGTNGVDAARIIRRCDDRVLFIYMTNFENYILKASDTFMFRFLIKPVAQDKFNSVFEAAHKTLMVRGKTFEYTNYYDTTRLYIADIVYFERLGRTIQIHSKAGVGSMWNQIGKLYEELSPYGFVRPHKSFLVNIAYIHKVSRKSLVLNDFKTEIPIGSSRANEIKQAFMNCTFRRVNI